MAGILGFPALKSRAFIKAIILVYYELFLGNLISKHDYNKTIKKLFEVYNESKIFEKKKHMGRKEQTEYDFYCSYVRHMTSGAPKSTLQSKVTSGYVLRGLYGGIFILKGNK